MKYTFLLKTTLNSTTLPLIRNMPQPFYWDKNVNYTIEGSNEGVYDNNQQKLITTDGPHIPPEDLSAFQLGFMSVADASPTKKQKHNH